MSTREELEQLALDIGYPDYTEGRDYPASGDDAYKPKGAYGRDAINSFIEGLIEDGYRKVGPEELEWGVKFRGDGIVERKASREAAIARASEFSQIYTRDHKLKEEIPPSDPERGRALVSRVAPGVWVEEQL